jgi:sigma-B regulation protein RsbU (phosphoserine phosphatase)
VGSEKSIWKRLSGVVRNNLPLTLIIGAALLLELTSGVLYYSAQNIIHRTVEKLIEREMNAIYLCIRNKLAKVEVTVDNMAWVVADDLEDPDWMYSITQRLVENNPSILGCMVTFVPDYFPQKGHWFEPYAVRRADGTIETMQLGSAEHDYTKIAFYTEAMAKNGGNWCEPYYDKDGARAMVTTYSVPVHDDKGKTVGVVGADIALDWLEEVVEEGKFYKSTQRYIVTEKGHLLAGKDSKLFQRALQLVKADEDKVSLETIIDEKGDERHVYFHPVGGNTNWILVSIQNDREVFSKLGKIRANLLLPVLAGLILIGFIVWRTSRNLERLRKVNAEKDRIGGELRVASQIQQSMLPHSLIQHADVDIFGSLVPAREVGGDLYDYYIRDEKLFFCIGDVSGKGAPSAMVMGVMHSLFRAFSAHENNPARMMQAINEISCQGNESNIFVTMFIGVLDLPTGRLRYCDAGHDAPIVIEESGDRSQETGVSSQERLVHVPVEPHLPVGVFDDVKYGVQEMQLEPDSTLFLYTDGLTEAKDSGRKQFGMNRVEEVLRGDCPIQPRELIETITRRVHQFVGDAEQSDDLTMLAIHYTPKHFESRLTETLLIKNDVHEVSKFSAFMKSVMEKMGVETSLARKLRLAVEEAVVNVIDYAYPAGQEGDIEVRMMFDGETLKTVIIDSGVAFDPTAKEKADTSLSIEDRQIGGLGILLVRELMDSINYERAEGQNFLTLIKKLK